MVRSLTVHRRSRNGRRFARHRVAAVVATVVATSLMGVVPSAAARTVARAQSAKPVVIAPHVTASTGLHLFKIDGRRFGVRRIVHVLEFSGTQFSLQIGLAHQAIDGGRQTPGSMCRTTVGCVAAVNGDFFDWTPRGQPDPADEVGGITRDCVLLHTPEISHQQANLDGQSVSAAFNWTSTLDVNGVTVPITAINQQLPMSYVQVHLPLTGTLLFTSPYALRTPVAAGRVTYVFSAVNSAVSPTTINATAELSYVIQTTTAVAVSPGQVAVSTPLGSPLANLVPGDTVSLTTTSTSGCDSIGGHPILLDHGVANPVNPADTYMTRPYARTVIGWTTSGATILMTVDGADGVSGATASQLVRLLRSINVVTALDLDGGNSTTLYARGRVLNRPSHGTERRVSTALLVVKNQ